MQLPSGSLSHSWSGVVSGTGSSVTVRNAPWNGVLAAGESTTFGFQGTGTGAGATVSCSAD